MKGESSRTRRMIPNDTRLLDTIFSWSLVDIFNEDLFQDKVVGIGQSFESPSHYYGSFVYPLLEETRAQLCSRMELISEAPFAEVIRFTESKPFGEKLYNVVVDCWRNSSSGGGKEPYKSLPGDIFVLTEAKPESIFDLEMSGRSWNFASVVNKTDDEDGDISSTSTSFRIQASEHIKFDREHASLFVVFLVNIIPSKRMWSALHMDQSTPLINKIIRADHMVEESCDCCDGQIVVTDDNLVEGLSSSLNESQRSAVFTCISKLHCNQRSALELIWGPPGTGKTKTLVTLLLTLWKMQYRVLTCAPTNVAITEVASRFLSLMKVSFKTQSDSLFCSFGDVLLFGNNERLKVGSDLEEIYLDPRLKLLLECFTPSTGWRQCFASMINFLEDCVSQYHIFMENKRLKEEEFMKEKQQKGGKILNDFSDCKTFLEFAKEIFVAIATPLRKCIFTLCRHISRAVILEENVQKMVCLIDMLGDFETLLFKETLSSEALEKQFSFSGVHESPQRVDDSHYLLYIKRTECISVLRDLQGSLGALNLPSCFNQETIKDFCFQTSSIIFCTSCTAFKLYSVGMVPLNVLVIDEAAQMKECESIIPLKLPGIKHAILVGDERQLPAMVESHMSSEAGFGRSLYERLSFLGYSKYLLNTQYRMHPSISSFPNSYFYFGKLCDAYNVQREDFGKRYLPGRMFGPYSFINVVGGVEERGDVGRSRMNMVEVAVVTRILKRLYKEWIGTKESLSIGVISPYAAQVAAIQAKLRAKYDDDTGFLVEVRTIDGFQGGELDIIIMSTVRTTGRESLGFISSPQRINVALTRARHCLWILGNERTLTSGESVWEALVLDAKHRQCFFHADEDKDLANTIVHVKKQLNQFENLLCEDSVLFKSCRWKVLFSDNFLKSFRKLKSVRTKKSALNLLLNLASGWRPKRMNTDSGSSSQILKQFKVESFYVLCSIDIVKESWYFQVLKIWDILPLEDIGKLVQRLNNIFERYSEDYMNCCKARGIEGKLEVPVSWPESKDIVKFKSNDVENEGKFNGTSDGRSYAENSMVGESLILMKFFSLSPIVLEHLITNREGSELDLPFEVTDEELEIILYPSSTFILGRSGTGKTTVLTMKLYQKEKLHHLAAETVFGPRKHIHPGNNNKDGGVGEEIERLAVRQLFVTVSPKLCSAVKNHVTRMKRSLSVGKLLESSSANMEDIDAVSLQLRNIPNSFVNIPVHRYPLVITFEKFLMMLDGTLPNSYFERFSEIKKLSSDGNHVLRSVALERLTRMKEVNYDKFASSYWPRFNSQLTKTFDCSMVFTEIMSHIKGGPQAADPGCGKLSWEEYAQIPEKSCSLSRTKREQIYKLFKNYEKMKMDNGEFDLADLVIYLHQQLRTGKYVLDEVQYVYVDEVQDLTMSQIALFRYICKNVKEGFVFSGDTAQTIARGINFRFQDIRALFYKKFVLAQAGDRDDAKRQKGLISDIFRLSQNFRTHAGVLKLSQSIIDLLYCFFPHSIDVLKPETSLISGESPVVLELGDNENPILKIFGNIGNMDAKFVGFGAEQVILVRDDTARKEISGCVGKHALVLTIMECKGLEFQDVLLYNFFGSSPLKNEWRIIYQYMNEQNLLDSHGPRPNQSFSYAKHNVLCSELKQLYVAVTRTRQRLWICENTEDLSIPMFYYWKEKCLVQAKKLDDSLVQAMQVPSSAEEWKLRGQKLYQECNYEIARMCFERAGDAYWERRSKAAGLKASADRMWTSNTRVATAALRAAGEIYESIKMSEFAAQCYSDVGDYERAGKIYMEKSGEPDFERAGACFLLGGCYKMAAEVYNKGNLFSDCLKACSEGKLYDIGFNYIQNWKDRDHEGAGHVIICRNELEIMEQGFLEGWARHYFVCKDYKSMMKFVKAFHSIDLMRAFLNSRGLLDELLFVEEGSGNFSEAANIARLRGDIILQADLLGKARKYEEASHLILVYVLSNSLWSSGRKGWPLKQFSQKEKLLEKVKLLAKNESSDFFEFVSNEAETLSMTKKTSFSTIVSQWNSSRKYRSARSEFLSIRRLLDAHVQLDVSQYVWQDELIDETMKCIEEIPQKDQISGASLIFFWRCWKDKIITILEFLESLKTQDVSEHGDNGQFALELLGVLKHSSNDYLLLNPDADWVRKMEYNSVKRNGMLVCVGVKPLVSAARIYWSSELLSVGLDVLDKLQGLHKHSIENELDIYHQCISLVLIYQIAKFLLDFKLAHRSHDSVKSLEKFITLAIGHIFHYVFPLDWRKSLSIKMVSLRGTEIFQDLLKEVLFENARRKSKITYGQLGRIAVITLGSPKLHPELHSCILQNLQRESSWREYLKLLFSSAEFEIHQTNLGDVSSGRKHNFFYMISFLRALEETYHVNWTRESDYIHPNCFLYLVERFMLFASCHNGYVFTTKASFLEWLIYRDNESNHNIVHLPAVEQPEFKYRIITSIADMIMPLLSNMGYTKEWIKKSGSKVNQYCSFLVLRLIVILCLLDLSTDLFVDALDDMLSRPFVKEHLPLGVIQVLQRRNKQTFQSKTKLYAEAFKLIGNPLVIVAASEENLETSFPDAVIIDMKICHQKQDVLQILFPKRIEEHVETASVELIQMNSSSNFFPTTNDSSLSSSNFDQHQIDVADIVPNFSSNDGCFQDLFDSVQSIAKSVESGGISSCVPSLKGEINRSIQLFGAESFQLSLTACAEHGDKSLSKDVFSLFDDLKQLSCALDESEGEVKDNTSTICKIFENIRIGLPKFHSLHKLLSQKQKNNVQNVPEERTEPSNHCNENRDSKEETITSQKVGKKGKNKKKSRKGRR